MRDNNISHEWGGINFCEDVDGSSGKCLHQSDSACNSSFCPLSKSRMAWSTTWTSLEGTYAFQVAVNMRSEHMADPYPFNIERRDELSALIAWDMDKHWLYRTLQHFLVEVEPWVHVHLV